MMPSFDHCLCLMTVIEAKILWSHYHEAKKLCDFEREERNSQQQIKNINSFEASH